MAVTHCDEILSVCELLDKVNECCHSDHIREAVDNLVAMTTKEVISRSYLLMYLRHCAPHLVTTATAHQMLKSDHVTFINDSLHVVRVLFVMRKKYPHISVPFAVGTTEQSDDIYDRKCGEKSECDVEDMTISSEDSNKNCDLDKSKDSTSVVYSRLSDSGVDTFSSQSEADKTNSNVATHNEHECTAELITKQELSDQATKMDTSASSSSGKMTERCERCNQNVESYMKNMNNKLIHRSKPVYRLFRLHNFDDLIPNNNFNNDCDTHSYVTQTWNINSHVYQATKLYEFSTEPNGEQSTLGIDIDVRILEDTFTNSQEHSKYILGKYRYGAFEFVTKMDTHSIHKDRLTSNFW